MMTDPVPANHQIPSNQRISKSANDCIVELSDRRITSELVPSPRPPFVLARLRDAVPAQALTETQSPNTPHGKHGVPLRAENSALHSGHFDGNVVCARCLLRLPDGELDDQGILNFSDDLTSGCSDVQIGMLHGGSQHDTRKPNRS